MQRGQPDNLPCPKPGKSRRWLLVGLGIVGAFAAAVAGIAKFGVGFAMPPASSPEALGAVTVIVQRSHLEPVVLTRSFVAIVRPRIQAPMAFQVSGRVCQRLVEVGDHVVAGQELARLTPQDFQLTLDQARFEVAAATEAEASASAEARRITSLNGSGDASTTALEASQTAFKEARARLDRGHAQVKIAQNALEYATLRSGTDGVVVAQSVEVGQVVAAGQPVLTIAQAGALEVEMSFPEGSPLPSKGSIARFIPWSAPEAVVIARLREISPSADAMTHSFLARFTLAETASATLTFGMTGRLETEPEAKNPPTLRVPSTALYDPGAGPGVWRVTNDDHLAFVMVKVERLEGTDALVSGEIGPSERIVAVGANRLRSGTPVVALERTYE